MRLMTTELLKARKRLKKNGDAIKSKKVEQKLVIELKDKLEELLEYNDRAMLEIHPNVVGEFLNILSDKVLSMYDFEQIDNNKFIFYSKEITI